MKWGALFVLVSLAIALLCGCGAREESPNANVIRVKPGQSIQAAIDQAPVGAVVLLAPGTWQENLRLTKSLTLRGEKPETTAIMGVLPGEPVVWVGGEAAVSLESLTIQEGQGGFVGLGLPPAGVFVAEKARVNLARAKIKQNAGAGLVVRDEATLELRSVTISANTRYGVEVLGQGQAILNQAQITQNKMGGIWAEGNGVIRIENATITDNLGPGIWTRGSSVVYVFDAEICRNRGPGVQGQGTSCLELREVLVLDNTESGVHLTEAATFSAFDSTFQNNWQGLEIRGGTARIESCFLVANLWDGVQARGEAAVILVRSEIRQGKGSGVAAVGEARVQLVSNRITGFSVAGVSGFSAFPVEGEDNEVEGNSAHILGRVAPGLRRPLRPETFTVLEFPHPDFPDLQSAVDALLPGGTLVISSGTYEAAILIGKPVQIKAFGDVILLGNGQGPVFSTIAGGDLFLTGVHITGGSEGLALSAGASAELRECWLWENITGIKLWHDAQLRATKVSIARHSQGGVWAWDKSQVLLEEATVYANDYCGVGAGGSAVLRIRQSTLAGNTGQAAVLLVGQAQADLLENILAENAGQAAVLLRDQAQANLQQNVFSENKGYGVDVVFPFQGRISGGGNIFTGNKRGAVRLAEFSFLER